MYHPILNDTNRAKIRATIEEGIKATKSEEFPDVHLVLYTDGGCDNNGDKIGGWGIHGYWYTKKPTVSNSGCKGFSPAYLGYTKGKPKADETKANVLCYVDFFSGLTAPSTSNIAELLAMLNAFALAKAYDISSLTIQSDSEYTIKGLTQYINGWIARGWVNSTKKPVANKEEWLQLNDAYHQTIEHVGNKSKVKIVKVKGHSGDKGNDRADELATSGAWGVRNLPEVDSGNLLVKSVDDYWGQRTFPGLFTETRLFFNPQLQRDNENLYYQSNLPYSGTETKKEQVICKRVTDLLLSVVKLKEPELVIDGLQNYVVNTRNYTGVFKGRLDTLKNVDNYQHLEEYPDGRYLIFNDELNRITLPNKANIFNVINQARLSYRIFGEFDYLREILGVIENGGEGYTLLPISITDYMYDSVPKGKSGDVFINKMKPSLEDSVTVPVVIPGFPEYPLVLTFGVDIPSKLGFNKFKDANPEITLYLNLSGSSYFNYYVHVKTDEGVALYGAPYSNEILLPTL